MKRLGIIEHVGTSKWASPIVPVPKADGSVRICENFRVTINFALEVEQDPLPRPEDIFATFSGGQQFSILDLECAYLLVELDAKSRSYVTINTHKGLFRYTRLPFGVARAPAIFQQVMEQVLHGIPNVACYLDDILIKGKNEVEHLQNLTAVFERLRNCGLRLKKNKCQFMENKVAYLGYRISSEGLRTAQSKGEGRNRCTNSKESLSTEIIFGISELLCSISSKFGRSMSSTE
ncbi:uncharacterized protein K02A2.6-like [Corticium candelabrum]|uniref:uncharacterized protein K02A2.6-like n=1 Tax=Corticium candelabrum TaxID=121492 RepID=UPI002E276A7D|nr:uncharacterized protein K02A2.6-like [Corticium candelabrum]